MNEGSGEIISDKSGNDNSGTIDQASWIQGVNLEARTTVKDKSDLLNNKPSSFSLNQNYPNPFNSTTTITFNLPKATILNLKIYDLQGRLVKSLIQHARLEVGIHSVQWSEIDEIGNRVGSGVYLYNLESGDFCQLRKLVLLK